MKVFLPTLIQHSTLHRCLHNTKSDLVCSYVLDCNMHYYLYMCRISGWDVKKFPRLYDKFHIGDQLLSINDVHVTDLAFVSKLVKNVKGMKY